MSSFTCININSRSTYLTVVFKFLYKHFLFGVGGYSSAEMHKKLYDIDYCLHYFTFFILVVKRLKLQFCQVYLNEIDN